MGRKPYWFFSARNVQVEGVHDENRRTGPQSPVVVCTLGPANPAPPAAQVQGGGLGVYQEQLRVEMDQQSPEARQMAVDAGGWFNFASFNYDDAAARKERTMCEYDLRVWARANVNDTHHSTREA